MQAWQATVQDDRGNALPNPVVTVYLADGETLATVYTETGAALPNPITGSIDGFVQFYAMPGRYKVQAAGGDEWDVSLGGIGDTLSFADRATAESANVPSEVSIIQVAELSYKRDPAGNALTTADGGTWVPNGVPAVAHWAGPDAVVNWLAFVNTLPNHAGVARINSTVSVRIPQDFPNMQAAFDALSAYRCPQGVVINIRIDVNHQLTGGLRLQNGDFSHFSISSTPTLDVDPNATIRVSATFPLNTPIIEMVRCNGPRIIAQFDADGRANRGIVASLSRFEVLRGGVDNVSYADGGESPNGCGLFINDGTVFHGPMSKWRNNGRRNGHVTGGCTFKAQNSIWQNAGEFNLFITRGCNADISAGVIISGGTHGLVTRRSIVAADGIQITGASSVGISAQNASMVNALNCSVTGCDTGVDAIRGSTLSVRGGDVSGNTRRDLWTQDGATIDANLTTTSGRQGGYGDTGGLLYNHISGAGVIMSAAFPPAVESFINAAGRRVVRFPDGTALVTAQVALNMQSSASQAHGYGLTFTEPPQVWFSVATADGSANPVGAMSQVYGGVAEANIRGQVNQWRIDKSFTAPERLDNIPMQLYALGRWR